MLRRLIYVSRSLIGADSAALEAIISASVQCNAQVGVTGVLWFADGKFAQVLEGEHNEIERAMDRIRSDPRHTEIVILLDRTVSSRQFGTWSMRRSGPEEACSHSTTFMIGFALGSPTDAAKQLYNIIMSSDNLEAESSAYKAISRL